MQPTTTQMLKRLEKVARELEQARRIRDRLVVELAAEGLTTRQIAKAAGISHQRVSVIVREHRAKR